MMTFTIVRFDLRSAAGFQRSRSSLDAPAQAGRGVLDVEIFIDIASGNAIHSVDDAFVWALEPIAQGADGRRRR
jgi:hypothetical protein